MVLDIVLDQRLVVGGEGAHAAKIADGFFRRVMVHDRQAVFLVFIQDRQRFAQRVANKQSCCIF